MNRSPTLNVNWQNETDAERNTNALTYGYIREFLQLNKLSDRISSDLINSMINFNRIIGIYMDCSTRGFKWADVGSIIQKVNQPNDIYIGYQRMAVKTMDNKMLISGNVLGKRITANRKPFYCFQEIPEISNKGEIYLMSEGTKAKQTIVVTTDNRIYCIGSNVNGEFGNGKRNQIELQWIEYPDVHNGPNFDDTFDSKLIKIHGSAYCTFWLSQKGTLYQSGYIRNDPSLEGDDRFVLFPTVIPIFEKHKITDVTSGNAFVMCLCDNGKVFTWGENAYGQCGINEQQNEDNHRVTEATLCKLLIAHNIKQVECGGTHTVVIDEHRNALLFGNNDCGQIGNGDYDMSGYGKVCVTYPYKLRLEIKQAAAGGSFTLVLADSNILYFMGSHFDAVEPLPTMVQFQNYTVDNAQIVQIFAWHFYSMLWMKQ